MINDANRRIGRRVLLLWLLSTGVLFSAGGFVIGRKWPIETVTKLFPAKVPPLPTGWTLFATTDFPRYEMGRVIVGSRVIVFGGFYAPKTQATTRTESLDLTTGRWTRLADLPSAVTHITGAVIRDTVWVVGGFVGDDPGRATEKVWRYSIANNDWSPGPSLPEARAGGGLLAYGDTLHYFGGYLADRSTNSEAHWLLTPGASTWTVAPSLISPRGHLSALRMNDALYAFGGTDGHDPLPIDVTDVTRFDLKRNVWEKMAPMPLSVSHVEPSTMVYDRYALLVGGRSLSQGRGNRDDIRRFDPETARWLHLGHLPKPFLGGISFAVGDTLFAGMGAEWENVAKNLNIWRRTIRNAWWTGTALPMPLGEVAAGVIGDALFVVGDGSRETLRYDFARGDWTVLSAAQRPAPGDHHAAEVVNGKLVLLGGFGNLSEGVVQMFDPVANRWTLGPKMPFAAGSSASAVINGKIYVVGGIVKDTTTPEGAVLDLATGAWAPIAPMPKARNHAASATDGVKLYVFGGRGPGSGASNAVANGFAEVQIYDPATNRWSVSSDEVTSPRVLPVGRGGTGKAVFLNGEFWIVGGETATGEGATAGGTYERVDIYDPVANRWRRGPDLPTARHGIFPVAYEGLLYVAGGGITAGYGNSSVLEVIWPRVDVTRNR